MRLTLFGREFGTAPAAPRTNDGLLHRIQHAVLPRRTRTNAGHGTAPRVALTLPPLQLDLPALRTPQIPLPEMTSAPVPLSKKDLQLGGYLLARAIDERPLRDEEIERLRKCNDSVDQARRSLPKGRGNVDIDFEKQGATSAQRVAAARVLTNRLAIQGKPLGPPQTVAISQAIQAGNCSEHGDVGVHTYVPLLKVGEQVHKVIAPSFDHGWSELRAADEDLGQAIVMDPWAEGPAVMALDGAFTHADVPARERQSVYAYGPLLGKKALKSVEATREMLGGFMDQFDESLRTLQGQHHHPEERTLFDPTPCVERNFSERVAHKIVEGTRPGAHGVPIPSLRHRQAATRIAIKLGSDPKDADFNAGLLIGQAVNLCRVPQNPPRVSPTEEAESNVVRSFRIPD